MSQHLGERLSALIDGELGHQERDRALGHLAGCDECRAEADELRKLKSRLRAMEQPAIPADLTMSLLRMAEPGEPLPPRPRPLPGAARPARTSGPRDGRPSSGPGRPGRKRGIARSRGVRYAAVGVVSAAVALGTLFVVGGIDTPTVTPPVQGVFYNDHFGTTGNNVVPLQPGTVRSTP
ncbi:anti-sigma factor family protein [Bailinhaonella thermotolerans]|uniref:Anti-sigma factor n=1 Tax=Bailinhaonella thermotolerans TaxID=1070861 RepID=A0A3A4BQN7_9ACTN|nr:zf-HC2 domain-containing protein [Bailinhaonella thermotolerans]RJL33456.1 anti-sigma factor [Bailinhaonella thermotolerans]